MESKSKTCAKWPTLDWVQFADLRNGSALCSYLIKNLEIVHKFRFSWKNVRHISTDTAMNHGTWGTPVCQNLLPSRLPFLCYLGFKLNTWDQLGVCVRNLDMVLEAMGSYEKILFGESEMIHFMKNVIEGSKTRGRKTNWQDDCGNPDRKPCEHYLRHSHWGPTRRHKWELLVR